MAQVTSIEWTEYSWNFLRGCSRVSSGCINCYAEKIAARFSDKGQPYHGLAQHWRRESDGKSEAHWTGEIGFYENILLEPLKWKKPRKVFVNSMSDLFHKKTKDEWLDKAFAVMALTPHVTYQILTKRPERMLEYLTANTQVNDETVFQTAAARVMTHIFSLLSRTKTPLKSFLKLVAEGYFVEMEPEVFWFAKWPLPNCWLGVSVEDQKTADERISLLLGTPAAVRWISAEPLLEPLDIRRYLEHEPSLNWCVAGGESGANARPCSLAWLRSIVSQCKTANVPVFVKQLGTVPVFAGDGGSYRFHDRKGGDSSEWPEDLRVREYPA